MVALIVAWCALSAAAQISPDLYAGLQWRNIGPYHGGRVASIGGPVGTAAQAGVFYAGMPQGGIWKTTSAGTTWFPIFDQVTGVDSIGAIVVAPSDPNIIYAGSGDAISATPVEGNGMYKSTDAGKTWAHIGLEGTRRIGSMVVDPKNPDVVVVAAMAGANGDQRGIFRTEDGGRNWTNVLHVDDTTGGRDLSSPYDQPNVIFATTILDAPGGGGRGARGGPSATHLYKSLDEGKTWTEVSSNPETNGRLCVAVAMHTNAQRVFVYGSGGLYRSDNQGATWKQEAADDIRIRSGDYISGVWVDTQNPDVVFTFSTAAYKSTDGGNNFFAFKGAPGGEDFHEMWIDPTNDQRMAMGVDQGAPVSLDGGNTWSSYYALPVAQVYHISTDNRYPYWVLASQQDTGAVMTRSRGNNGDINETDWLQNASSEFGTVTADPTNPDIVYGLAYGVEQGTTGTLKINVATGQWDNINPEFGVEAAKFGGEGRDQWRRFDPFDPHTMYTDFQCLVVSHDQGESWSAFSPALTTAKGAPQEKCGTPATAPVAGAAPGGRRGGGDTINDFAIGTVRKGVFWTVSGNGQIFNSTDNGLHWNNVSNITDAPEGAQFLVIEAGHGDINTAYVSAHAPGGISTAGNIPLIWRTHDGGKTWTKIVNGLPSGQNTGSWVNVVREDPYQKNLLFAGTESAVYVSFDDGDHWQSLRNNMPTTSIRDMIFHTDDHMSDLVIGTYGRGFYVLDDTTPLRELATKAQAIAAAPAYLFKPGDGIRARISDNWDQPWNYELPWAPNPPFGVVFYYHLSQKPQGEIKLQVYDAHNNLIRTISSIAPTFATPPDKWPYPAYWVARPEDIELPTKVGTNRWNWDLRYDDPPAFEFDLENLADVTPGMRNTPAPHGLLAAPGTYTLKLTVDGQTYTQTVVVHNDPRVGESPRVMAGIRQKNELMVGAWQLAKATYAGNSEVEALRGQVAALNASNPAANVAAQVTAFNAKLAAFGGGGAGRGGRGGGRGRGAAAAPGAVVPFNTLNNNFDSIVSLQEDGDDNPPTQAVINTYEAYCKSFNATLNAWKELQTQDVSSFNETLTKNNLQPIHVTPTQITASACTVPPLATRVATKTR